jgi:hypothetical protein
VKRHIICDIDGTVSDLTHRLHHVKAGPGKKNWDAFHKGVGEDPPHLDVVQIVKLLRDAENHDMYLWFVTGRMDYTRKETEYWLATHIGHYDGLFMRKTADYRPDDDVKHEIFTMELMPRNIVPETTLCVIDDRNRVVDRWRELGFRVLQVAPGDF